MAENKTQKWLSIQGEHERNYQTLEFIIKAFLKNIFATYFLSSTGVTHGHDQKHFLDY